MGRIGLAEQVLPLPFRNAIDRVLERKGQRTKNGTRNVGYQTTQARRHSLMRVFAELYELGYKVQAPEGLRSVHIEALVKHWVEIGAGPSVIQNKLCTLRMFAEWIGKPGMVKHTQSYVDDPSKVRRYVVAQKNRAWDANGIDPHVVVAEVTKLDQRIGLYLRLMFAFGLRLKEALCLKPLRDVVYEGQWLSARDGTKGGRQRMIPIENDYQRETLLLAQCLADKKSGTITPRGKTLMQAYRQAQYRIRKCGFAKDALGVTPHGLRHQYAQSSYEKLTGKASPICGGNPKNIDAETHAQATYEVMGRLGHSRTDVGASYCGSYGHALRGMSKPVSDLVDGADARQTPSMEKRS